MMDNPLPSITTWPFLGYLPTCTLSLSLSLSLQTLINFQTNLFIVHHCLSAGRTSRIDSFPPHSRDFTLTLKMARNYSLTSSSHFIFAKSSTIIRSPVSLFPLSLSHFALQTALTFLVVKRREVYPPSETEGCFVDSQRIP